MPAQLLVGLDEIRSRWGSSGVMTFIVNQQGRVYQKNLGPATQKTAMAMTAYNPDKSWELVDYQAALLESD